MTETKRLGSSVVATSSLSTGSEGFPNKVAQGRYYVHLMRKHQRLVIHGDHWMLSLFSMHFHEQDFLRIATNQYRMTFSQTVDRSQGENRQLLLQFDTFCIQRESISVSKQPIRYYSHTN